MAPPPVDLTKILNPALLQSILNYTFPWKGHVDVKYATKLIMARDPDNTPQVFDTVHFQALKPLSSLRPAIPDLTRYLPSPADPVYPERVLALILLIDQAPRILYSHGMDISWVYGYFDHISKQFVKTLLASGAFPDSTRQWAALGYSFEDVMFRRFLMYAPFIHSEDAGDHVLVEGRLEEMRREIEAYSGQRDPGRDTRDEDRQDELLFSEMLFGMMKKGAPPDKFAEFFFWIFRLYDVHYPIVAKYGRYPYRNEGNGREFTEEEEEFMRKTKDMGRSPMTEEEVRRTKEHILRGTWEELSDERV